MEGPFKELSFYYKDESTVSRPKEIREAWRKPGIFGKSKYTHSTSKGGNLYGKERLCGPENSRSLGALPFKNEVEDYITMNSSGQDKKSTIKG